MDPTAYHLLYEDDAGDPVGLDEVQLLPGRAPIRVNGLRALLRDPDVQAAQVLTAWGHTAGLHHLERVVEGWPDAGCGYYSHRIWGYDNTLDLVAEALEIYAFPENHPDLPRATALFRELLRRYGPVQYESRLKDALLNRGDRVLAPDVRQAVARADALGRSYLASQRLPVLARSEGEHVLPLAEHFLRAEDVPNPRTNVAEALRYLSAAVARPRLEALVADPDPVVADEARRSIAALAQDR